MRRLPLARSASHRRRRKSGRRSSPSRLPPIPGAAPVPTTSREMAAPAARAARGAARAVMPPFVTSATSAMTWCAGGGRRMPLPPAVLRRASVVRQAQRYGRLIPALYLLPDADKLACPVHRGIPLEHRAPSPPACHCVRAGLAAAVPWAGWQCRSDAASPPVVQRRACRWVPVAPHGDQLRDDGGIGRHPAQVVARGAVAPDSQAVVPAAPGM